MEPERDENDSRVSEGVKTFQAEVVGTGYG